MWQDILGHYNLQCCNSMAVDIIYSFYKRECCILKACALQNTDIGWPQCLYNCNVLQRCSFAVCSGFAVLHLLQFCSATVKWSMLHKLIICNDELTFIDSVFPRFTENFGDKSIFCRD